MQDKKIIKKDCDHISLARCFYGFFGKEVEEKAGKNIVTISNVRKTLRTGIEGLSEEEKSDFDLICSIFISRRVYREKRESRTHDLCGMTFKN